MCLFFTHFAQVLTESLQCSALADACHIEVSAFPASGRVVCGRYSDCVLGWDIFHSTALLGLVEM